MIGVQGIIKEFEMDDEHDLMMEHLDGWEEEESHECPGCAAGCDSCLGISNRDFW